MSEPRRVRVLYGTNTQRPRWVRGILLNDCVKSLPGFVRWWPIKMEDEPWVSHDALLDNVVPLNDEAAAKLAELRLT